jgi:hypothetical protein
MPNPNPKSRYTWNASDGRYRDTKTGRYMPWKTINREMERELKAGRDNIRSLSEQYQRSEIRVEEWRRAVKAEIKQLHVKSAVMAKGGRGQMTPADYGRVGQRIRGQYQYLDRFSSEVQYGKQPLDGRFLRRADMYGSAARQTYQSGRAAQQKGVGKTEKMSVLGIADHCEDSDYAPGCLEEAAKGWVPIDSDEVSDPGDRTCHVNCRCHWAFR